MTMRPAPSQLRVPKLSDPAPLKLTVERISGVAAEMLPLMRQHHAEAGLEQEAIPLDPDWDRLFSYDRAGIVHLTTARNANLLLVGYAFSIVAFPIWHAATKAAHLEILYLDPLYREGLAGYRLLKQHFQELRQAGAQVIKAETPDRVADGRLRLLLKRLGMKEIERVYYLLVEP